MQPWSQWRDASSLEDGVGRVRRKLGQELVFGAELKRVAAYADMAATVRIAEVVDFGTVAAPCWRYRIRARTA